MNLNSFFAVNLLTTFFCLSISTANAEPFDYFAQPVPKHIPLVFDFSKVVPAGMKVSNPTFSPDGQEFYFAEGNSSNIFVMRRNKGKWLAPVKASFSDQGNNYEPFITTDNKQLYFISTRPPGNGKYNGRIWSAERMGDGEWSSPKLVLDRETKEGFWFPSSPRPGVIYFGATLKDSFGEGDFYRANLKGGDWQIEHLPAPFNDKGYEWDPLISPDGSYMIFESQRDGGYGGTDIYVSFNLKGKWSAPISLGKPINTPSYETAATITPDGKYMFYTLAPDEGSPIIYWVSTQMITDLRPE